MDGKGRIGPSLFMLSLLRERCLNQLSWQKGYLSCFSSAFIFAGKFGSALSAPVFLGKKSQTDLQNEVHITIFCLCFSELWVHARDGKPSVGMICWADWVHLEDDLQVVQGSGHCGVWFSPEGDRLAAQRHRSSSSTPTVVELMGYESYDHQ